MRSRGRAVGLMLVGVSLVLSAFVAALILLPSHESRAAAAGSVLERVQQSGQLRVNVLVGEEPGFIKDPATGGWSGHFWDIATAIAEALQVKLVPVETTWGNVALDLQAGKIDMAVGVNPTPQRALVVDYTLHPIYYNYFVVVGKKNVKADTWADLNKPAVRIGVEAGSSHDVIATRFAPNANIIRFRNRDETLLALEGGRIDLLVNTLFNGLIMVKRRPELGVLTVPSPFAIAPVAIAVPRESGDKAWLMFLSVTSWNLQPSGFSRAAILKYLGKYGITVDDFPKGVSI